MNCVGGHLDDVIKKISRVPLWHPTVPLWHPTDSGSGHRVVLESIIKYLLYPTSRLHGAAPRLIGMSRKVVGFLICKIFPPTVSVPGCYDLISWIPPGLHFTLWRCLDTDWWFSSQYKLTSSSSSIC